jgi:hypothetical protein
MASQDMDIMHFCQLLAKIAYSYGASCAGISRSLRGDILIGSLPSPLVTIINRRFAKDEYDTSLFQYIGAIPGQFVASDFLHGIGMVLHKNANIWTNCVYIRLFGFLSTPIYQVVLSYFQT